jgi:hypothetical protein
MKAIKSLLLAAALTAVGFSATLDVQAARSGGHGGGGARGVNSGGHGGGHWSGGHGGGHWGGGHYGHSHGYYPYWGFYWGAPLLWGSYAYYWGYPYGWGYPYAAAYSYADGAYPQSYPQPYPQQGYPEGAIGEAPTTQVNPNAQGAPAQGPAYLNFCASANAYYPKVTSCPEGWKFQPSR